MLTGKSYGFSAFISAIVLSCKTLALTAGSALGVAGMG